MADKKLEDYIKKELRKGFSEEKIKKVLLKAGHPKEAIEEAFKAVKSKKIPINNKKLIILVSCFIIIVIAISFYIKKAPYKETEEGITVPTETRESSTELTEDDMQKVLQVQAELKDCLRENVRWGYGCLALVLNNEKLCNKLTNSNPCYYKVGWKKALPTNNSNYCNIMSEPPRNFCKIVAGNNINECYLLEELEGRINCKAILNNDIKKCEDLNNDNKTNCKIFFLTLKSIRLKKDYCEEIKDLTEDSISYNNCKSYLNIDPQRCIIENADYNQTVIPCYKQRDQKLMDLEVPWSLIEESDKNILRELIDEIQIS